MSDGRLVACKIWGSIFSEDIVIVSYEGTASCTWEILWNLCIL